MPAAKQRSKPQAQRTVKGKPHFSSVCWLFTALRDMASHGGVKSWDNVKQLLLQHGLTHLAGWVTELQGYSEFDDELQERSSRTYTELEAFFGACFARTCSLRA